MFTSQNLIRYAQLLSKQRQRKPPLFVACCENINICGEDVGSPRASRLLNGLGNTQTGKPKPSIRGVLHILTKRAQDTKEWKLPLKEGANLPRLLVEQLGQGLQVLTYGAPEDSAKSSKTADLAGALLLPGHCG